MSVKTRVPIASIAKAAIAIILPIFLRVIIVITAPILTKAKTIEKTFPSVMKL
jgi:hypothetical protein